jgi:hypothetical protein
MSHPEPDCDDNPARWEYARFWGEAEGAALFRPTRAGSEQRHQSGRNEFAGFVVFEFDGRDATDVDLVDYH